MKWALINVDNIVESLIVYDGFSPYEPAQGLSLKQINDWVQISQSIDQPEGT